MRPINKSRLTLEVLAQFADIIGTAKNSGKVITNLSCADKFAGGIAKYYDRSSDKPVKSSDLPYDKQVQQELWGFSMKAVGLSK